jgi:polyphosphate glucokinase
MQALGSYEGGRMLFLGLGTGLGSTLIAENVIVPLELGDLPHLSGEKLWRVLGRQGLKRLGKRKWREAVRETVEVFTAAFVVDYVVLGGGNARVLKELPIGSRLGHNLTAFRGGFRLWKLDDVPTLSADIEHPVQAPPPAEWRVI